MSKLRVHAHNKPAPAIRLSQRIAEEAQLLAEEKWIIEALKKIKAQKNSLQIERLHMESMRTKILATVEQSHQASSAVIQVITEEDIPEAVSSRQPPTVSISDIQLDNINISSPNNEELCNTEELNLSVTNSVFNTEQYGPTCDEEEEEEDMENCLLDMDLLMSGK